MRSKFIVLIDPTKDYDLNSPTTQFFELAYFLEHYAEVVPESKTFLSIKQIQLKKITKHFFSEKLIYATFSHLPGEKCMTVGNTKNTIGVLSYVDVLLQHNEYFPNDNYVLEQLEGLIPYLTSKEYRYSLPKSV